MRILVVCVPRSGTTSFLNTLSKVTNIPLISLPDNYEYPTNYSLIANTNKLDNIILRIVPSQNVGTPIEEFSKLFDLTIFLSRKNEQEQLESYINLYYSKNILGNNISTSDYNINLKYDYEDIPKKYINEFFNLKLDKTVKHNRSELEKIASNLKKDIIYYEDLYSSKKNKKLINKFLSKINVDTKLFFDELSKTKKQRIVSTKKII